MFLDRESLNPDFVELEEKPGWASPCVMSVVPPTPPGYLSDTQSSGQTLPISTSLSTKPLSDSGAHGGLGGGESVP